MPVSNSIIGQGKPRSQLPHDFLGETAAGAAAAGAAALLHQLPAAGGEPRLLLLAGAGLAGLGASAAAAGWLALRLARR
ncbi:MAG: hypothetical protein NZO58_14550, partial [Gemmataceae bacterium]|nr:hypothetical protein [Gemmataceae bacterium]